jgi:hypothetical protein
MARRAEPGQVIEPEKEEVKIRWKNIGGGSFWLGKHIMKPGQIFYAFPSEIPGAFRDVLKPVDEVPVPGKPVIQGKKATFEKRLRQDKGKNEEDLFDVVNEKGKALNGKGLTEELADEFLKDLQG